LAIHQKNPLPVSALSVIIQDMQLTEDQIRQEAAECYARKVSRAKRMTPIEKFLTGAELFEDACKITLSGIRNQYPHWTTAECIEHLKQRFSGTKSKS
jgi:hypothetical protein